jgi:formate dehydrogenase subunit gamma
MNEGIAVSQQHNRIRSFVIAAALVISAAMVGPGLPIPAMAQQIGVAPRDTGANPNARNPTADSVNEEALFKRGDKIQGVVTIPDRKASVLEQPQGREWRGFHEGAMPWIGGIAILGMILALAVFFVARGRIRLEAGDVSGREILRFNAFERFTHWMTATCFIVLALSGLNYIFGKRLLQPIMGPEAFTALSQYGKYAHNFLAWPFMLGIALMLALWVRDNIPNKIDVAWLKAGGGLFTSNHPSAGRFNAGQKMVFWIVVLGGFAMSASGIMLLFPFAAADINGMQAAQAIHAVIGVLFIAAIIAHIYIGSLGMEGAYEAMGSGEVDLAWARAHHDLWVEEQLAKTARGPQSGSRPAPAE